jgi:UDP-glucose 4-epimerase
MLCTFALLTRSAAPYTRQRRFRGIMFFMAGNILVTGGAGYIGSHACVALIEAGYQPVVIDNLVNSSAEVINRIERITGVRPHFIEADLLDDEALDTVFANSDIAGVMHFAGLKAVGESVEQPLAYYHNNVGGTISLLQAMQRACVQTLVFSSSATVYGEPPSNPMREDFPRRATNPYGQTKVVIEDILADQHATGAGWNIACLRYFNPVGAHTSGLIGEAPGGIPNNLMPYVSQVAVGQRKRLQVFGNDYSTVDGTGVRDYIHVGDLVDGHLAALQYLKRPGDTLLNVNLGRGVGVSVLQMVAAFEQASGQPVPYEVVPRRAGDIAQFWADSALAESELGWTATRGVEEMCADAWRWQSMNPRGYED